MDVKLEEEIKLILNSAEHYHNNNNKKPTIFHVFESSQKISCVPVTTYLFPCLSTNYYNYQEMGNSLCSKSQRISCPIVILIVGVIVE